MALGETKIQRTLQAGQRRAAAEILYAAFERKLRPMLGSNRAPNYIAAALVPERCMLAVQEDRVVGVMGLQYDGIRSQQASLRTGVNHLGLVRGLLSIAMQAGTQRDVAVEELYVETLAVRADQRRRGIGTKLLQEALTLARELGKERATLEVVDTNPGAYQLYEGLGFRRMRTKRYPFTRQLMGFAAVHLMQLDL